MTNHQTSPVGEDAERAEFMLDYRKRYKIPDFIPDNTAWAGTLAQDEFRGWQAARRAAPALDASGLPPLPAPQRFEPNGREPTAYSAEQVRQAQRDAYATGRKSLSESTAAFVATANKLRDKRDAEIAELRAQLEGAQAHFLAAQDQAEHYRARCAAPTQPKAQVGSIDSPEFRDKLLRVLIVYACEQSYVEPRADLIAYIDAWAGSRAGDALPDGWKLVPVEPTNKMTAIGQDLRYKSVNSIGAIYRAMLAAAPAPGKQAGNDQDAAA